MLDMRTAFIQGADFAKTEITSEVKSVLQRQSIKHVLINEERMRGIPFATIGVTGVTSTPSSIPVLIRSSFRLQ